MTAISIIGAGAWGTALAQTLASKGSPVTLWCRNPELAHEINERHENTPYLPRLPLNPLIHATSSLYDALKSDVLLMVTPAQSMRAILQEMSVHIRAEHALVLCSKGLEISTGKMMGGVVKDVLPETDFAVLTGPNFAHEIAAGQPAATTLACANETLAQHLQSLMATPFFRPYITDDVIGAQIAGALKNVIAICCGIAYGMGMGESTRATLVTRGMAEIARLGCTMGAKRETFMGLCGFGDMILTCSSEKSRNFSLGTALGQGKSLEDILSERRSVTEGVHTTKAAVELAAQHNVAMPISLAVHKCLNEGQPLDVAIREMLNRPLGYEL